MKLYGVGKFPKIVRRLKKHFASRGFILMYHRIADTASDPWSLCVSPQHFSEHLEVLQKYGCPIGLQQLTASLNNGNVPHRTVVLTFDDGYADNFHNAKPLLERYGIPATFFVTTGQIAQKREFWWDELDRLLLQPGILPETLCLNINGSTYVWELGRAANYSEDDYRRNRNQEVWNSDPGSRHYLYYSIWRLLQPLQEREQQTALDEIRVWAGAEPTGRSTHRSLSLEELCMLEDGGLIEIGAHTVTHSYLSVHPVAYQQDEIQRSKAELEALVGGSVASFAYPYGNYSKETMTLVKNAGFTCACSTYADSVWRYTDPFALPRFEVKDWNGEEFARQLLSEFALG